jgi:hypothetical protein
MICFLILNKEYCNLILILILCSDLRCAVFFFAVLLVDMGRRKGTGKGKARKRSEYDVPGSEEEQMLSQIKKSRSGKQPASALIDESIETYAGFRKSDQIKSKAKNISSSSARSVSGHIPVTASDLEESAHSSDGSQVTEDQIIDTEMFDVSSTGTKNAEEHVVAVEESVLSKRGFVNSNNEEFTVDCFVGNSARMEDGTLYVRAFWVGYTEHSEVEILVKGEVHVSEHIMHSFSTFLMKSLEDWRLVCLYFFSFPASAATKRYIQKTLGLWVLSNRNDPGFCLYRYVFTENGLLSSYAIDGPFDLEAQFDQYAFTFKGIPIVEICGLSSPKIIVRDRKYRSVDFPSQ